MTRLSIIVSLVTLASCSAPPKIVGAPPPGISYRVENGNTADSSARAMHYCEQFGKHASLQSVSNDGGTRIAQYACS